LSLSVFSPDNSSHMDPFTYDYDTLRTVGLFLAIVMFVLGILIALSESLLFLLMYASFMPLLAPTLASLSGSLSSQF
uniref:FXYD domain-containing ion transport regulator n=1 Tax=Podarcis muralis TaxID=64176 RepID=A0A670JEG3_PODMU